MLFKKKEHNDEARWVRATDVDDLKAEIEKLREENNKLNDKLTEEISRLSRIVKYSSDIPTYNLKTKYFWGHPSDHTLYVYCDKEEYIFELSELGNTEVDKESYKFKVKDDFAYFNLLTYFIFDGEKTLWKKHEFIIDFRNGRYIHSVKEVDKE